MAARRDAPRWELYRLLSDPTRLKLLALASIEELAVSELAELLRELQPKVSRHAALLREAGLLSGRKQGTWLLLRLTPRAEDDEVVADALAVGVDLCKNDGTSQRVAGVIAARDAATREFFAKSGRPSSAGPPAELGAYLRAMAPLIESRRLAIDAGTGDGSLLEVLAPLFERVIALDRSGAQLDLARERAERRQFQNVSFVCGEIDGPEIARALTTPKGTTTGSGSPRRAAGSSRGPLRGAASSSGGPLRGADAVFAARVLHHAPVPSRALEALALLARAPAEGRPGGAVLVLDYESHGDDALRERAADLWLGFEPAELVAMAENAGLCDIEHGRVPRAWQGDGPDSHIHWQWLSARRSACNGKTSGQRSHQHGPRPKRGTR